jgi:xanthine dehydrogenase accessory factor
MNEWIDELSDLTAAGERAVLVTVAGIRGSAPREVGAKMIVTEDASIGTIGGGQLEYQSARLAYDMLERGGLPSLQTFSLGTSMGQCCGGVVDILFEPIADTLPGWLRDVAALHGQRQSAALVTHIDGSACKFVVTENSTFHLPESAVDSVIVDKVRDRLGRSRSACRIDDWFVEPIVGSDFNIAVFGAGHVGTAVVQSLSNLDCNIRWIDSRRDIFRQTPRNARPVESSDPALEVTAMPAGSCYLVMTHSHALDYAICERILIRQDAAYCGLIGSVPKRRRFEKRYRAQGLPQAVIDELVCPIGVAGIQGKKPAEIAVAAAADVLRAHERFHGTRADDLPDNVRSLTRRP